MATILLESVLSDAQGFISFLAGGQASCELRLALLGEFGV